ncbi:MAG: mannose-6-phosphate isomerase [Rhodocyclaceae bacterium]|nr:MAG: mannose-6-phosphate isomerase [Rhodocyclaceae bacterium]TND03005.1 MAG: mannose-6-phosphate isomerase [Rhodocyclaceae bacterium]
MITLIDNSLLDELCAQAAASPRRRKNRNFHPYDEHPGHRLLNAMQTDSYIPPHRHLDPNKDETFVVLRGLLALVLFDDQGGIMRSVKVGADGTAIGVDIPHGTWHTAVALVPDTVFLEAKAGPYLPFTPAEKAPWAPAEYAPEAAPYLAMVKALVTA